MTERRFHLLSLLGIILGLLLFFTDVARLSFVRETVKVINTITSPLLNLKEEVINSTRRMIEIYFAMKDVREENLKLRNQVESLLMVERELSACIEELNRIKEVAGQRPVPKRVRYFLTRIIFYDPSGLDQFVIVEGGKDRKVKEGDVVVTQDYVLGVVESVYGSTSRVITPLNEKFSSSAYVKGTFKKYIYKGAYPEGRLLHVNIEDKVKEGEEVMLLDPKRRIPPFPLGVVDSVRRGKDPFFKEVLVKPLANPRKADYVFVIRREG